MACLVCDGLGRLLSDPCPLCDGDNDWVHEGADDASDSRTSEEDSEGVLFACVEEGRCVRVAPRAVNAFFSASFSVSKLWPPRFAVRLTLGSGGAWLEISSLSAADAERVAEEVRVVSASAGLPGVCGACDCLLRLLGWAEARQLPVASSGASAAEAVCAFYDGLCESEGAVAEFQELIRVTEVLPRIFQAHVDSRLVLASMFARPQEFYESPDPSIRGMPFSLGDLRRSLTAGGRPFDFYLRWPGFNLPSRVFEAFRRGALGGLLPREEALVSRVHGALGGDTTSDYYVIGTCEDEGALHHEMAHGLYSTNEVYRRKVRGLIEQLDGHQRETMRRKLLDMGYVDDVDILEDEFQAYMAGGDKLCEGCDAVAQGVRGAFHFHARLHPGPYAAHL